MWLTKSKILQAGSRLGSCREERERGNLGLLSAVSEIMRASAIPSDYCCCCSSSYPCLFLQPSFSKIKPSSVSYKLANLSAQTNHRLPSQFLLTLHGSNSGSSTFLNDDDDDDDDDDYHDNDIDVVDGYYSYVGEESEDSLNTGDGLVIEITKLQNNSRRIRAKISINASFDTVWKILTGYDKLADFIPALAVSKLIERKDNFARVYQIAQQNLAFGIKFNAKAILDCYEKDLQTFASGKKRDIEFKMTEGDFQIFEGKWSIEQVTKPKTEGVKPQLGQEYETTLSYLVVVKPKLWLPVHLIEGRMCKEIKSNLSCIREEAQKVIAECSA